MVPGLETANVCWRIGRWRTGALIKEDCHGIRSHWRSASRIREKARRDPASTGSGRVPPQPGSAQGGASGDHRGPIRGNGWALPERDPRRRPDPQGLESGR